MITVETKRRWYTGFMPGNKAILFRTRLDVNAQQARITYFTGATWCFGPASLERCNNYARNITHDLPVINLTEIQ